MMVKYKNAAEDRNTDSAFPLFGFLMTQIRKDSFRVWLKRSGGWSR